MDFYKLSKTVLFQGATPEETEQMLSCLKAGKRKYKKEEMIYRAGEVVSCVGVVLSGSVLIENDDIWGNRSVLERAGEGEIFAETYASIPDQKMLVNVIAAEDTEILFLNDPFLLRDFRYLRWSRCSAGSVRQPYLCQH